MDIDAEPGEDEQASAGAGDVVVYAESDRALEPRFWPQFFDSPQPQFPRATFCAFSVAWDELGRLTIRLVLESPDGVRDTVEVGPLPVAGLIYFASYAVMEAYWQMLAYSQVPYGAGGVANDGVKLALSPGVL